MCVFSNQDSDFKLQIWEFLSPICIVHSILSMWYSKAKSSVEPGSSPECNSTENKVLGIKPRALSFNLVVVFSEKMT